MKVINEDGSTSSINKGMEDSYFGQCLKSLEDMEKDKGKRFLSHDSNAINDPKIIKLTDDHGLLGYGIY